MEKEKNLQENKINENNDNYKKNNKVNKNNKKEPFINKEHPLYQQYKEFFYLDE